MKPELFAILFLWAPWQLQYTVLQFPILTVFGMMLFFQDFVDGDKSFQVENGKISLAPACGLNSHSSKSRVETVKGSNSRRTTGALELKKRRLGCVLWHSEEP